MRAKMKLKNRRKLLYERLNKITTAEEIISIQIDIANEIISIEQDIQHRSINNEQLIFHIKCLRLYADALAWWNLHPHTIRQLAKNQGKPPSLLNQGKAFDNVVAHAKDYFQQTRYPVIIADITNIIKIGDIIVITNAEKPQIVECKSKVPSPKSLMRARIGRQVSRAIGTLEFLSKGRGKVFGQEDYSFFYYRVTPPGCTKLEQY